MTKTKPKRVSAQEALRKRLEGLKPLEGRPTQEEIRLAYNALLKALRGD